MCVLLRSSPLVAPNSTKNPFYRQDWIFFAPAREQGQAAAINAAMAEARGDYLAILEDDDCWRPNFIEHGLRAIGEYDFVSSNQLEVPPGGDAGRINDFPTPSGWFMRRDLWREIGGMDISYRYHLDNDWLGRLSDAGKRRLHLVEAAAPENAEDDNDFNLRVRTVSSQVHQRFQRPRRKCREWLQSYPS